MRLRRLIATGLLLAVSALAAAQQLAVIPPLDGPVIDATATLSPAARQTLTAQALALRQRKGSQLQVLVVPTTLPEDIAQYATRAFDQYKLGRGKVDDGVLLVVAKDDRRARVEVGYGLEGAIPDATAARVIQEYLLPRFRAGDFDGGVTDASAALVKLVDGEVLPAPMAEARPRQGPLGGESWLFAMVAVLIASQVLRAVFGRLPGVIRAPLVGIACAGLAWLVSAKVLLAIMGLVIGLMIGASTRRAGRFARDAGFGGFGGGLGGMGGWGGGGTGGGGWSGGGGMSGGGGASGSW